MTLQSDMARPVTPVSSHVNSFWRCEDSGYHTSYTPSSLIDPHDTLNENEFPSSKRRYTDSTNRDTFKRFKSTPTSHSKENFGRVVTKCSGLKRSYQEDVYLTESSISCLATPTSIIAGGIRRLEVTDDFDEGIPPSNTSTGIKLLPSDFYNKAQQTYPTTPVKKACKTDISSSSCNDLLLSPLRTINNLCCPPKRSAKKLTLSEHSLPDERLEYKPRIPSKAVRTIFLPEKKVDIVGDLYNKVCCMPAIINIFNYLSSEDIFNFSLVSPTWLQVCEKVAEANAKKQEHAEFINNTKENYENRHNNKVRNDTTNQNRGIHKKETSLKDIHNIHDSNVRKSPRKSPPSTPRSMRFKRFTKSASMDTCMQMMCSRCHQPAKVPEAAKDSDGVQCTNVTCSYLFCRHCKCDHHPGKTCFQYDLNAPSPSKRRKTSLVGSNESKKKLKRLLRFK